jgi:predicted short-subunit dehydrogenase-like oxidoreductase (DUF2520 family)
MAEHHDAVDSIRRVMIVGCGRLGSAIAEALAGRGYQVVPVSARRPHSSADLQRALGLETAYTDVEAAATTDPFDLLVLTVPDDAIATVADEVVAAGLVQPGVLVIHPSGSLTSVVLESCRRAGAITASLHPLQTFPRGIGDGARFQGITLAFEGEKEAKAPLSEMVIRLGADLFEVPASAKAEYHTAAVLACNCLVALLHAAVRLFGCTGSLPGESMARLRPLIDATLDNITDLGAVAALTGPVSRGDSTTIARQLEVVASRLPEHLDLYRELSRCLVDLAELGDDADREGLERIRALLAEIETDPAERRPGD